MDFAALLKAERAAAAGARGAAPPADAASPPAHPSSEAARDAEQPPPVSLELAARADGFCLRAAPPSADGPRDIRYAAAFLSSADEAALRDALLHPAFASAWTSLRGRSLLAFGGTPTADGLAAAAPLPQCCAVVCEALVRTGVFPARTPPNHVLVNRYRPGQGIMPHQDGPLYSPCVAIVSLGCPAALDFWRSPAHAARGRPEGGGELPATSLLLQPRSLLVFYGDAYHDFYHGIAERSLPPAPSPGARISDWGERISLTVRHVPALGSCERCTAPGRAGPGH